MLFLLDVVEEMLWPKICVGKHCQMEYRKDKRISHLSSPSPFRVAVIADLFICHCHWPIPPDLPGFDVSSDMSCQGASPPSSFRQLL